MSTGPPGLARSCVSETQPAPLPYVMGRKGGIRMMRVSEACDAVRTVPWRSRLPSSCRSWRCWSSASSSSGSCCATTPASPTLVRTGARIASTGADHGPGTCDTSPGAPVCTSASSPALAQEAADAIQRSGIASNPDQIQYILVYKANNKGFPGADGSTTMPADCSGHRRTA